MLILKFSLIVFTRILFVRCQCKSDEVYNNNNCYYFEMTPDDVGTGELMCQSRGMHLVSIHSQFENNFLQTTAAQIYAGNNYASFLMGLTTLISPDNTTYLYTDRTRLDFNAWDFGQPDIFSQVTSMDWSVGLWSTSDSVNRMPYVCKGSAALGNVTTPNPVQPTTGTSGLKACKCDGANGLINPANGLCYSFHPAKNSTSDWNICNRSIRSADEDTFVSNVAAQVFFFSNCFADKSKNLLYAIGTIFDTNNGLQWEDGESADYYQGAVSQWASKTGVTVIAIVNQNTKEVTWGNTTNSKWNDLTSDCAFYVCKTSP